MTEEEIHPQDKNSDAPGEAKKAEDKPPIVAVEVRKEDSKENGSSSDAGKKKRKRRPLSVFEIWTLILGGFGILVAGGTGAAIVWQDRIANASLTEIKKQYPELQKSANAATNAATEAKNANDIARTSLEAVQRAFLVPRELVLDREEQSGRYVWLVGGNWENVGNTTAVHAVGYFNALILSNEPNNQLFIGSTPSSPIFIGPKTMQRVGPILRPDPFFTLKEPPTVNHTFAWGWVAYSDGLPKTPMRISEFCRLLISETTRQDGTADHGFLNCKDYNCADDDCSNYQDIVRTAENMFAIRRQR